MKVKIYTEKEFEPQLRKLSKNCSMLDDYDALNRLRRLKVYQGTSLGKGVSER